MGEPPKPNRVRRAPSSLTALTTLSGGVGRKPRAHPPAQGPPSAFIAAFGVCSSPRHSARPSLLNASPIVWLSVTCKPCPLILEAASKLLEALSSLPNVPCPLAKAFSAKATHSAQAPPDGVRSHALARKIKIWLKGRWLGGNKRASIFPYKNALVSHVKADPWRRHTRIPLGAKWGSAGVATRLTASRPEATYQFG